jgi:hypothetical protein
MSRFFSTLFTACLVVGMGLVVLLTGALEPRPLVAASRSLSSADGEHARHLVQQNNSGRSQTGTDVTLMLSEADVNLVINYLLEKRFGGSAQIDLVPNALLGDLTVPLPLNPIGAYLNIALQLQEHAGQPRLTRLTMGRLELPVHLDVHLIGKLSTRLFSREELPLIYARIRQIQFQDDTMVLVYRWDPELITRVGDLVLDADERRIVGLYYQELVSIVRTRPDTLANLLQSMFLLARERAARSNPETENRAALIALGLYAVRRDIGPILPQAQTVGGASLPWVTLQKRVDLARHYLVSAAVTASSDSSLSDIIGVYKEWSDSREASGFSFADLAANRAGTRLGQLATASSALARQVQDRLAAGVSDGDLLPPVEDLPEDMSEEALDQSFGGIGSPRYENMVATIERRLNALPLYRMP